MRAVLTSIFHMNGHLPTKRRIAANKEAAQNHTNSLLTALRRSAGSRFKNRISPLRHIPQHRVQNPAVAVVIDFNRCIDPTNSLELDL